jgi:hypothetical protein
LSDITDKIKKLLRLGQSSNQHEAELALQRAYELANRHHINVSELDLEQQGTNQLTHRSILSAASLSYARRCAISYVILPYFHVHVIHERQKLTFVGREEDILVAEHVYAFLVSECQRALKRWSAEHELKPVGDYKKSFIKGFFAGLRAKLSRAQPGADTTNANAIILAEANARTQYMRQQYGKLRSKATTHPRRESHSAVADGYTEGSAVTINQTLNNSRKQTGLLH